MINNNKDNNILDGWTAAMFDGLKMPQDQAREIT